MANDVIITDTINDTCCTTSPWRYTKQNDILTTPDKIIYQKRTINNYCDLLSMPENGGELNERYEFASLRNVTEVCKKIFVAQNLIAQISREKDEDDKGLSYDAIRHIHNNNNDSVGIVFKNKNGEELSKIKVSNKKSKKIITETINNTTSTKEIKFDGKQLELEYKTKESEWEALTNISEDVIKNLTDIRIVAKEKVKQ